MATSSNRVVKAAFEAQGIALPITDILPMRLIGEPVKRSRKYARIAASIREIGLVEPLVVTRDRNVPDKYLLLDGHLRLEALKDMGSADAVCMVSTDDEAFTYNKRINRLAIIQEHRMILKAMMLWLTRRYGKARLPTKKANYQLPQSHGRLARPDIGSFALRVGQWHSSTASQSRLRIGNCRKTKS